METRSVRVWSSLNLLAIGWIRHVEYQLRLHTTLMQTAAQRLYQTAGYRQVGRGQIAGAEVMYFARSLT
jgi:hypothetical protein